jgi:serine/threonine protein kinase
MENGLFLDLLRQAASLDVEEVAWKTGETLCDGRFVVAERLGGGGMGVVYRATDRRAGVSVALKTVRRLEPRMQRALAREFRLLQGVHHPNIVRLGDLLVDGERWFFTMELVEGVTIDAAVFESLEARRAALLAVADALHTLHRHDRVHCDVKPSNVMVARDGRVVLLDFGIALHAGSRAAHDIEVTGTGLYMAPEQAMGHEPSPASDWYSFGLVVHEVVTGERPPFDPREVERGGDLGRLVAALLAPEPERRPTGEEVLARLAGLTDPGGVPFPPSEHV